ncbi:hypothetical protein Acr_27g0010130 [Actinidia rufa]|uniref:Retrotransposon gag domain-containing protein n=1 Tax=Actinidia rufa TaxID=165716 RepID=A0A7J0H917_9ERIC|nr:hypothetical protein Acr_27g0010130 [Actinidia rufa]
MGHLTPFLRLAAMLASRNCNVTLITVKPTVSAAESAHISAFFSAHPHINRLEFEVPPTDSAIDDPFFKQLEAINRSIHLLKPLLSSSSPPLNAIFSDFALATSVGSITDDLCIPNYVFVTTSARFFSLMTSLPSLISDNSAKLEIPGFDPSNIPPPIFNPNHFFTSECQTPSPNPPDRGKMSPWNLAKSSPLSSPEPPSKYSSDRPEPKYCLLLALGRAATYPDQVLAAPWIIELPPMANASQVPDLEGLHHEIHGMAEQMRVMNENNARLIQLLAAANPQPPAAPSVPDVERSRHSNRSGDRSHNVSAERARGRRRSPSPSLSERSSSSESSQTRSRVRRGRSPRRGDHTKARDKSTSQRIRDLDARLDAINTGTNALVTVDTLGKTDPMDHLDSYKSLMSLQGCSDEVMCKAFSATLNGPARSWFRKLSPGTIDSFGELSRLFVANFMSCRNRQKNASHLFTVHQKETESLKDFVKRFNQAILEVEDPSDKVIIMAMMEGLRPGPLFDSLSKNVPETLSALQSKANKYIAAEELVEAKRRQ